ncbi:MAG: hypothetical protein AAFV93_12225, partial [Chloroflexota bacterium]
MLRSIALLLLMFMLVACGSESTDTDTSANDTDNNVTTSSETTTESSETENDEASDGESIISISGAEEFIFEQELSFGCAEDLIHIQTFSQAPKFDLYLPASVETGTYDLADFDSNSETSYVEGQAVLSISGKISEGDFTFYFQNSDGQLEITSMPSDVGELKLSDITWHRGDFK